MINSGFMIWKNCEKSIDINKYWINLAKNKCKYYANTHPRQKNVYHSCLFPKLNKKYISYLDHKLVGMPYSIFIRQTKKGRKGWKKMGKPNKPIKIY